MTVNKTESFWQERRNSICLAPGTINLNAGSCSPTCRVAFEAQIAALTQQSYDPVERIFRYAPVELEKTRLAFAQLVGCAANDLLLFNNTTYGVNTVARSLTLKTGDEILLSDQEYSHYVTMWQRIAAETGAKLVFVPLPLGDDHSPVTSHGDADLVGRFAAVMSPRSRVLFFSHVTSNTGMILPATALCALARQQGLTSIVDGAHALGQVPVDLGTMRPDYYAATVHKWLMGPVGSACLYVAAPKKASTLPLITTGTFAFDAAKSESSLGYGFPTGWIFSHEYQGTRDYAPLIAAQAAFAHHSEVALASITARTAELSAYCREHFERLGLPVVSLAHPERATCLVAARVPMPGQRRINIVKAVRYLREHHQIELAFPVLGDGTPLVRVANAWFVQKSELDQLAKVLAKLPWEALV